tara:strand:- start:1246 stop:1614 length:369 start_codon:yes stop_codon:yes gene_type:complete
MTSKQKKQVNNFIQSALKLVGCSLLFLGMTMALGIKINPHMELTAYIMLFAGTILIMTHSFRANDHMFLLVASAGFLLVGNSFLDTETAIQIANNYGIALAEEEGWFAKYGKLFVEIIKAVT